VPARARTPLVRRGKLQLVPGLAGRLVLGGREQDVDAVRESGAKEVQLGAEDWGVLWLAHRPSVRLVVMQVPAEALPPLPREVDRPLWMSMALSTVAIGLFLAISFLRYDPDRPKLALDDVDERFTRAMWNYPPKEIPEEEPEPSDSDEPAEKARKKAGGEEGKFGRPDARGPSNVPRLSGPSSNQPGNVGLVSDLLAQKATMDELLTVGDAIAGTDTGPLVIGQGLGGMGLRGSGSGGGGEGEGQIHGTADVDMGGGGTENRKRTAKTVSGPAEKKPTVEPGHATVKGQLSKELIDKEVRRHRSQMQFCYQKQLTRAPNLAGKVSLQWVIAMDGSVVRPKVKSSSLGNDDVESCLVRALGNWKFPKPEGGVVEVIYPFVFGAK